jgi:hypothetical protein
MGTDARGRSLAPHAGFEVGLPRANAATLELWGFRGVRSIKGRPKSEWTQDERDQVQQTKLKDTLMWAGHIGVSFDGGKSIMGFQPAAPLDVDVESFIVSLMAHDAYPGIVQDDTAVFKRAERYATELGWDTRPIRAIQLVDTSAKAALAKRVAEMSAMGPGEHGLGYSFPLPEAVDGEHFAASNGFCASNVANCATFPAHVGIATPEPTGNARHYIEALGAWISDESPVDFRSQDSASKEGGSDER